MTQGESVIEFIKKYGSINRKQAINKLYIYNLTAVISDLRAKGIPIETVTIKGQKATYCKYTLADGYDDLES